MTAAEPLPLERLSRHLVGVGICIEGAVATPLGDGHSNLTYLIRDSHTQMVLRRPPHGVLAPSTHDVLREAKILTRLHGMARVPRVLHLCADASVIGAPFYLMDYVPGIVLFDELPGEWHQAAAGRAVANEFVDALVDVHGIDWAAADLGDIGRHTGYLERQLRRFKGLAPAEGASAAGLLGELHEWLALRMPESPAPTVVHGDYRLGNVLFAPDEPIRLAVVLDWEMATLGDPLADLGFVTAMWSSPLGRFDFNPVTQHASFPSAEELAKRYARKTGRDLSPLPWYQVFALWRLAVLVYGATRRMRSGPVDGDPPLVAFPDGVEDLAARAWDLSRM